MSKQTLNLKTPQSLSEVQIESERLRLVPVSKKYLQVIYEEFTPQITLYMMPASPREIGETESFLDAAEGMLRNGTDLICAILKRGDGEFLGCCGLHAGSEAATPELGIWLKKSAHGNGFGREAITRLKEWADRNITYSYLVYPVDRNNLPSRRIPEHLGGYVFAEKQVPNQSGRVLDEVIYRIDYKG